MLLKSTFVGGLAVAGLIAAAGYAKADVLRVNVAPAAVAPAPAPFVRNWGATVRVAPVRADDHRGPQRHRHSWRRGRYHRPPVAVVTPGHGGYYRYTVAGTQSPAVVAAAIRAEADRAAADVRLDVRHGVVYPPALASLAAHREELERDLAFASAKGYITVDDRARLERRVQDMRDLRVQFRRAHEGRVTYLR
jgi:hypothetical protein